MTMNKLKLSVAIAALAAAPAFGASHETATEEGNMATTEMNETTELEQAGDAINETANDVANSAEEMADDAGEATDDAADSMAETADEATDEMAEEADEMSTTMGDTMMTSTMLVGDLIGKDVYTANDEVVGEIDYIVQTGETYAAVIGIGGFLGLGEYTVALPLEEFSAYDGDELKLASWTEEELKALPEVDESELNALDDDQEIQVTR